MYPVECVPQYPVLPWTIYNLVLWTWTQDVQEVIGPLCGPLPFNTEGSVPNLRYFKIKPILQHKAQRHTRIGVRTAENEHDAMHENQDAQ